jgi:hypothetical protein
MKKLLYVAAVLTAILFFFLGWNIWQNNRDVTSPSRASIQQHFDRSITWLSSNYSTIENDQNPILWWMIKQAALNTNNKTLTNIFSRYKKDHLDTMPANLSTPMFNKFYHPRVPDIVSLSNLYAYQIFLFYGLSCDEDLGSEPIIQQQMKSGFCSLHYLQPRCITHQLMGLRFMQRYQCSYDDQVQTTINELQKTVRSELTWDFRIGDAYIQRVSMLVDTGAYDQVKPIWLSNVLAAQNKDGSWDDLDPILSLGNGYVLAHTSTLPRIQKPKANFHTTAQAIWLLSLLLEKAP